MKMESIASNGYVYMFVLGFLAATVIPLGSEWLLAALLVQSYDPVPLVLVATTGNVLGALTTYMIGIYGGAWLIGSVLRISEQSLARAEGVYRTYGAWSLLLSWVPVIGDPLCLLGGVFRLRIMPFTVLVTLGKLARYAVVAGMTLGVLSFS